VGSTLKKAGDSAGVVRFGVFEVTPRTGELRKQGLRVKLQEQPFRVLCLLLARPGELVTREELRAKLWSADTFVDFEHGLNKAMSKLREALGDDRETPRYIETLPRRGYRFIAPAIGTGVPEKPAEPDAMPPPSSAGPSSVPARGIRWLAPAVTLLLLVLAVTGASLLYRMVRGRVSPGPASVSAAPIRSLAVLPLQNLSGDKNQEYFADGMTDELITDLAQMSALRVISRTSVMHYKQTDESWAPTRSWRAPYSARATACVSPLNSSTRDPTTTSGLTSTSVTCRMCSFCRTKSRAISRMRSVWS
jgi:DNA-binding winged helix-turn-helix (wHTH) protein